MNYFGMFFSFMIPGILIGIVAAACARDALKRGAKKAARRHEQERRLSFERSIRRKEAEIGGSRGLYVADLGHEGSCVYSSGRAA